MNVKEILAELESLGDEKRAKINTKRGATNPQFGVKRGDLRKVAKKIKADHQQMGLALWETKNIDARLVSTLVLKPEELSTKQLDKLVADTQFVDVADWLNSYIVKNHPENESLRQDWMDSKNAMRARAGWNLTSQRVTRNPEMVDLDALLDRLESEMKDAPEETKWTMNFTLVNIGIHHPSHRKRALEIGERVGAYREYPTAKGCTSPYAPIWIEEMVKRQDA
jgi:3-methyladenine DNA glycosylase AlkD